MVGISRETSFYLTSQFFIYHNGNGNITNETKCFMGNTAAVHMRYNSWYISLPSSATEQQREMTKFYVVRDSFAKRKQAKRI